MCDHVALDVKEQSGEACHSEHRTHQTNRNDMGCSLGGMIQPVMVSEYNFVVHKRVTSLKSAGPSPQIKAPPTF
jgi:hypothetical protein